MLGPLSPWLAAPAAAQAFDVTLQVEEAGPPLPLTLPVTGSPLLLLIALLVLLVAAGSASLAAARTRVETGRED